MGTKTHIEYLLIKSFWTLSVVAVTSLTPSSGLVTLAIPDEPYSSLVNFSDTSHVGKRVLEGARHLPLEALSLTTLIRPVAILSTPITHTVPKNPFPIGTVTAQIRAPPLT